MTDRIDPIERPRKLKKTVFSLLLGGGAGFVGAFAFKQLADSGAIGTLGPSREIAALVGIVYAISAIAILAGVVMPKAGATFLNVEDAEELREQKSMLVLSGIGMVALAAALVIAALAAPIGPIAPTAALLLFAALMTVSVIVSLASRKKQDELMQAVGRESSATAFYMIFLIGGGWALAAHLGYVAAPAPLDWLTMFWGLGLLAALIVVAKRGMMQMR